MYTIKVVSILSPSQKIIDSLKSVQIKWKKSYKWSCNHSRLLLLKWVCFLVLIFWPFLQRNAPKEGAGYIYCYLRSFDRTYSMWADNSRQLNIVYFCRLSSCSLCFNTVLSNAHLVLSIAVSNKTSSPFFFSKEQILVGIVWVLNSLTFFYYV